MRLEMSVENDALVKEFSDLGMRFPKRTNVACDKMADVIRSALIRAAPYDRKNNKYAHLKDVICKTKPHKKDNNAETVIWVKPRGVSNAVKGKRASKNWNADKHIYKIVVSEYGRSDMAARPFWTPTVQQNAAAALRAGVEDLKKEIEK